MPHSISNRGNSATFTPPFGLKIGEYLPLSSYTESLPFLLRTPAEQRFAERWKRGDRAGAVEWLKKFTNPAENPAAAHFDKIDWSEEQIRDESKRLFFRQSTDARIARMRGRTFELRTERQIRRSLRSTIRQAGELTAYHLQLVRAGAQENVSEWARVGREQQLEGWALFQEQTEIHDPRPEFVEVRRAKKRLRRERPRGVHHFEKWESWIREWRPVRDAQDGIYRMSDISEMTKNRRAAEVYALLRGIQTCAEAEGLSWMMATLTAPPAFHANPKNGHSTWDGESTPADAQRFIAGKWRSIQRALSNHGINIAGFRAAEAHADGCAHWHVITYCDPARMQEVQKIIRKRFSWHKDACDFIEGDPSKGEFASYAMAYALKALRGEAGELDAWYSVWGIRRYQFLGVPHLQTWRELYKLKDAPADERAATVWRAVKKGDAATFISMNGGLCCKQSDRPIRATVETDEVLETKLSAIKSFGSVVARNDRPIFHLIGPGGHRLNRPRSLKNEQQKSLEAPKNKETGTYSRIIQEKQNQKPTPPAPPATTPETEINMATISKPWADLHGLTIDDDDLTAAGTETRDFCRDLRQPLQHGWHRQIPGMMRRHHGDEPHHHDEPRGVGPVSSDDPEFCRWLQRQRRRPGWGRDRDHLAETFAARLSIARERHIVADALARLKEEPSGYDTPMF